MPSMKIACLAALGCCCTYAQAWYNQYPVAIEIGPRPYYLINQLSDESPLKKELQECKLTPSDFERNDWMIGHRGACLQFPEHSLESYTAAAHLGAGIIECDVTFTKDMELVCRHDQCDLHQTTNILLTPLAEKCTAPFKPAGADPTTEPASATCCTSDITLAEFKSLCAKMDGFDPTATTPEEFVMGTPFYRTDLYATCATPMSHKESIQAIGSLGAMFTPEAKIPKVTMPFMGTFSQNDFLDKIMQEYHDAGVSADHVWLQSFQLTDILYLVANATDFAKQAVYLDQNVDLGFDTLGDGDLNKYFTDLVDQGVNIIAPAIYALVGLTSDNSTLIPSDYANAANDAGLDIITWSFERSPPMLKGGAEDYYYSTVTPYMLEHGDGATLEVLDVLGRQVGIIGIFSDWSATTTYYYNCILKNSHGNSGSSNGKGHRTLATRTSNTHSLRTAGF